MLLIKILIKALLITKVCQSLTLYETKKGSQPEYKSHSKLSISKLKQHHEDSIADTALNLQQPGNCNIYQDQYRYNDQWTRVLPNSNEQPAVINIGRESDEMVQEGKSSLASSSANYNNNKIYHVNTVERASPPPLLPLWVNSEQDGMYTKFIVRKQRNLKENYDDKLIEQQNAKERAKSLNEDNDQQKYATSSSSSPSSPSSSSVAAKQQPSRASHEIRYLHDIFLNYPKTHQINFGHVELSPTLFEKRFQSQKLGNRYKGEIMWLDSTGGFAQHSWDLAQGRL